MKSEILKQIINIKKFDLKFDRVWDFLTSQRLTHGQIFNIKNLLQK